MSSTLARPITIEEFEALPYAHTERMEIVRGEMVEKMSPGFEHGEIQSQIAFLLLDWCRTSRLGTVTTEAGFILSEHPLVLRLADVAFVSKQRYREAGSPRGFAHIAPDVAIEIISPSETNREVWSKVNDYLANGTHLVLAVMPDEQVVNAHTPDGITRTYRSGDTLVFPDTLPGFSCKVEEFFAQQ